MTDAVAQRVADLIRLASNAGAADNEARNAALLACRLITKHGLRVVATTTSRTRDDDLPPWAAWTRQPGPTAEEMRREVERARVEQEAVRAANEAARERRRQEHARARRPEPTLDMRLIHSRFATRCKACLKPVSVGDQVWWQPGRGVWHDACRTA